MKYNYNHNYNYNIRMVLCSSVFEFCSVLLPTLLARTPPDRPSSTPPPPPHVRVLHSHILPRYSVPFSMFVLGGTNLFYRYRRQVRAFWRTGGVDHGVCAAAGFLEVRSRPRSGLGGGYACADLEGASRLGPVKCG